ncbi:MAG: RsmB/NOP family class I SAM-dependent RNA methyltransferase [Candidatus Devosia phytovorans]|uniref:RsmB/NOP family class I SAM-dependent RNA methyltransferase n=1 Tax=Candidatus Devosia phytovorans TaxID=3121372 RepID=A0AAJ6B1T1_9HYPH|nr:RsmB/NOP family class I SAM-dependent RNA methyltransferase [Devosia sp.]WEK06622.1 MAG: RsmB/NOP family class I SAM-dependent RNA methyltransferase [Devosia sp.]
MRLPGRLSAAIDVLTDVETRKLPVSEALKAWGLNNRFAGAGDRAAIGNLVYDALRRRASHAALMGSDSPRALVLAVAVRDWQLDASAMSEGFAGDSHAPAALSEDELARVVGELPDNLPGHVLADFPEWLSPSLERAFGDNWIAEGQDMAGRPSLDLRTNLLKSNRERVMKSLARFNPAETSISPIGITMPAGPGDARTPNVTTDEGYLKGWFEVQDQGSQIVAALAGAKPGEQVLDLCAGAGGKTLALAGAMMNKGQIFAYDSDRNRLAPIYDRLKRNGARNVQVRAPLDGALDDLVGKMDRVVIDAPCTGTGTWRRRPDTKWKLTPELLAQRVGEQAAILVEGQRYLKPGGTLVYITCSILPEENDDQVATFIAAHPGFASVPAEQLWQETFGSALPDGVATAKGGIALTPRLTATDGFYFNALHRAA